MKLLNKQFTWSNSRVWIVLVVFAAIFSLVSIVNHFLFKTYGHDLGIYTHGIYMYSHFKMHWYTLGFEGEMYHLGNHFSPIMIPLSPLYYLFGSYTLLIVQIGTILFGGYGIYKIASQYITFPKIPLLILIQFFSMWGVYSALSYDFHTNVLAAMLVPWLFYYYQKGNVKLTLLFFGLILLTKENMALWMVFVLAGLLVKKKIDNKAKISFQLTGLMMGIAAIYFVVVQNYIMPLFDPELASNHMSNYAALGDSLSDIIVALIEDPRHAFSLLFESTSDNPKHLGIKSELHFMVFVSGGIALLYRPYYLIMLIPIYAQKMFSSNIMHWGINVHYSIEFMPIIALALIDFISDMTKRKAWISISIILAMTIFFTIDSMEKRKSQYYDKGNNNIFYEGHYDSKINLDAVKEGMKVIPDDVPICVHSVLVPRLANRDKIYHFPFIKDAKYIALILKNRSTYPYRGDDYQNKIDELRSDKNYEIIYEKDEMLVFKKLN